MNRAQVAQTALWRHIVRMRTKILIGSGLLAGLLSVGPLSAQKVDEPRSTELTLRNAPEQVATPQQEFDIPAPDDLLEAPADARRVDGGVRYVFVERGDGDRAIGYNDRVWVKFTAWLPDGSVFDTTERKGRSRRVDVRAMMSGLTELIQQCRVGDRLDAWLPATATSVGGFSGLDEPLRIEFELIHARFAPSLPEPFRKPRRKKKYEFHTSESGLQWIVTERPEFGRSPQGSDMVLAEFAVWSHDGELLDSTIVDGEPANFNLEMTIPIFAEAFSSMIPGERRILWAPAELAGSYQDQGMSRQGALVIEVTLLQFMSRPEVPKDVFKAPSGAELTPLGVSYRILAEGRGSRHPREGDQVRILYSGWTREGVMFDSSYDHGEAGTFKLGSQMPLGWNDAIYQMLIGERRRIWIPEELAYAGAEGRPEGLLIFDVELLEILDEENPAEQPDLGPQDRRR